MPQKIQCRVEDIIPHSERVYTVLLRPVERLPRFAAGQFLHLALDPYRPGDFWPDSRCFSIASSPSQMDTLRITYAVKGIFTTRMEQELVRGGDVWIKMPYGEFAVARDRTVCLLAGGTGITAFTAFLADVPELHPHEVHLFYGARRPDLLIYRSLAEGFQKRCTSARMLLFAEQMDQPAENVLCGRLDLQTITPHLAHPKEMTFYVAGPPAMLSSLTAGLSDLGVAPSQIIVDAWE